MQLKLAFAALGLTLACTGGALGQSLSPMHNSGATPSDVKGFRLTVGNPYRQRMTFLVIPMDTKFRTPAPNAMVNFPEVTMAPGTTRQVIVTFKIDAVRKERTIGVCVQPKDLPGTVLPRVCGTYTGKRFGTGG